MELEDGKIKRDNTGLVKIDTGGTAQTTSITIDGVPVLAERATIIIDPANYHNQIKLHCISVQNGKVIKGEVQTFYGISKENYEFFAGVMERISNIDDETLREYSAGEHRAAAEIFNLLRFVEEARKVPPSGT